MTNKEVQILMRLKDDVTKRLQGVESALCHFGRAIDGAAKNLEKFGRTMSFLGKNLIYLGASITGPLILAFKNAEKYSAPVREEMERLQNVTVAFEVSVANALIPVVHKLNNALSSLYNAWKSINPEQREAIAQFAFISGVLATLGGTILSLVGRLSLLIAKLTLSAYSNLPILMVVAAVIALIVYFEKLEAVAVPVLNAIEAAGKMIYISFVNILKTLSQMIDANILMPLEKILVIMSKIPDRFGGGQFDKWKNEIVALRENFKSFGASVDAEAMRVSGAVNEMASAGGGGLAGAFEKANAAIKNLPQLMSGFKEANINTMAEAYDYMTDWAKRTASAMSSALGDGFFNLMKGNFSDLKSVAADFGNEILRIIAQVIAKVIIMKAIMAMGGSFLGVPIGSFHAGGVVRSYHTGGTVRRAHTGYLASDEIPIIAQSGEGILSRRGMNEIGGAYGLNQLNRGTYSKQSGNKDSIVIINVVDPSMIPNAMASEAGKRVIVNTIGNDFQRNGMTRKVITKG